LEKIKKFLAEKPHTLPAVQRLIDRTVKEPQPVQEGITLQRMAGIVARMDRPPLKPKR
jgi:hypothetical protein